MGFEIEEGILKKFIYQPGLEEVVIPSNVTTIGYAAFYNNKNITSFITEYSGLGVRAVRWLGNRLAFI